VQDMLEKKDCYIKGRIYSKNDLSTKSSSKILVLTTTKTFLFLVLLLSVWKFSNKMLLCSPFGKTCLHQMYVAAFVCTFKLMHSLGPVWSSDIAPILRITVHYTYMHCGRWDWSAMNNVTHLIFTISLDFVANNGVETARFSILGPWKHCTLLLSSTSWTPLHMSHSFNLAWGFCHIYCFI
jgi:hypothetical protein